jgi:hypothetical protein
MNLNNYTGIAETSSPQSFFESNFVTGFIVLYTSWKLFQTRVLQPIEDYKLADEEDKKQHEKKEQEKRINKLKEYQNKFLKEWKNLSNIEVDENIQYSNSSIIMEDTPQGMVYLYYDSNEESFGYYCNSKHVQYATLEVIARKYCIQHNNKGLYIDRDEEIEKAKEEMEKAKEEMEKENSNVNSVFANLKNYKKEAEKERKNEDGSVIIVPKRGNRFSYKGVLTDHNLSSEEINVGSPWTNLDFKSFKAMCEQNTNI